MHKEIHTYLSIVARRPNLLLRSMENPGIQMLLNLGEVEPANAHGERPFI